MTLATPPDYGECPVCATRMLPILEFLPCGHSEPPIVEPLEAAGVVYSWTRLWTTADTSEILVMADFLDGTLRAAAPLTGAESIAIGDPVLARVGDDTPLTFTPAAVDTDNHGGAR